MDMTLARAALGCLLCLPVLAACQSTQPLGRIVTPSDIEDSDPPLNPDPKHIIRLHGRAPATLDFRFRIGFASTNPEGDCWNHEGFWEGGGEKVWSYDLYPVRKGESWEADFVVDRYLPGRCGWRIGASVMLVVAPYDRPEGKSVLGGARTVIGDARGWDETASQCRPGMRNCDDARRLRVQNADESIPVQVHCRWRVGKDAIGDDMFTCNEFARYKTLHYVKDHTRRIQIDLYDHGTTLPPESGIEESTP